MRTATPWLLLLLVARGAAAQEPVPAEAPAAPPAEAPGAPPAEAFPAPPPVERGPLATRYVWQKLARVPTRAPLTAITVQPGEPRVWVVADGRGAVYRTADAGGTWDTVLPPGAALPVAEGPDDEAVLLEAESRRDEELDRAETADVAVGTPDGDAARVEVFDADATAAAAESATELVALEAPGGDGALRADPTVWLDPRGGGVALLGRDDGLWRSTDDGRSWSRVRGEAGAAVFVRFDEVILAGGPGLRASLDGGASWLRVEGAAEGAFVHGFARAGDVFYAATQDGLFRSTNALQWRRVAAAGKDPVLAVVPDPDWADGFWLAGPTGLRRTDDGGRSFYSSGRQPLADLRGMLRLDVGHLLAWSTSDGVWESTDGGVRWQPVARLLTDPDVRDLVLVDGRPVIAARGGVWTMVRPESLGEGKVPFEAVLPLGEAVDIAVRRRGLDETALAMSRRVAARPFLPVIDVTGRYGDGAGREAEYLLLETTEDDARTWRVGVNLCFGRCGGTTFPDIAYGVDDPELFGLGDELVVIDGEVYTDDTVVAAAANVAQNLVKYRVGVASQVADAWLARQKLATERGVVLSRPVREQTLHQLAIDELDARLDAWTGGAWSAALTRTEEIR